MTTNKLLSSSIAIAALLSAGSAHAGSVRSGANLPKASTAVYASNQAPGRSSHEWSESRGNKYGHDDDHNGHGDGNGHGQGDDHGHGHDHDDTPGS